MKLRHFVMHISYFCILTSIFLNTGCSNGNGSNSKESLQDSLPRSIREVTEAVNNNDADRMSRLFSYPLERPYPLRNIKDAEEMKKYYSTLVDDSLKKVIAGPNSKEWQQYGWRGWSIDDGQYVWIDSLIYEVPYISKAELVEMTRLSKMEIESLWPDLRKGWYPVICLQSISTGDIYRIDSKKKRPSHSEQKRKGKSHLLRMAVYKKGENLGGRPSQILEGDMSTEGTMMSRTYSFTDNVGNNIQYEQDPPDGTPQILIISGPDLPEYEIEVIPVYWRDLNP